VKQFFSYLLISLFFFSITTLFYGCKDTINQADVDAVVIPDKGVSFQAHIQPVLLLKCAFSGCHDDQSRAAGLSFTNYFNTVADLTIVVPFEPQNSRLVWSVEGISGGTPMPPPAYPRMTANQIKGFRTWIGEGARNN